MELILWVLQGLLRLVALCVILYYTLICSIMIVRRGPRWWMRRSWDEVYDVQDRLNELIFGKLLEKRSKMKTVTIYTDGACSGNPGPGGWGAILMYGAHRKERRMTQQQLADECGEDGISRAFIQRIETGVSSCSVDTLIDIAKALNIPLAKLFEFKE